MHQSRRTYYVLLFLQTLIYIYYIQTVNIYICIFQSYQSPSGPVYTRTEKYDKFFGFTKADFNMKIHFKLPGNKGYVPYPERILDDATKHIRNAPIKAHLRTLIPPNREKIYNVFPPVPFWSCLYQKNTTSFSDLQDCLI